MPPSPHVRQQTCDLCDGAGRRGAAPCNGCAGSGLVLLPYDPNQSGLGHPRTLAELLLRVRLFISETQMLERSCRDRQLHRVGDGYAARLQLLREFEWCLVRVAQGPVGRAAARGRLSQIMEAA